MTLFRDTARTLTVLALDDEPANNELMERVFRTYPQYRLRTARSGQEACRLLAEEPVDIMLVDYSLPGMNGVEFLQWAQGHQPQAIGIMVTAYPELLTVIEAQQKGLVQHLVPKPWRAEVLMLTIERALALRGA